MSDNDKPKFCEAGYVDPGLAEYIRKFRSYQDWLDGGEFTEEAKEIKEMMKCVH